MSYIVFLSTKGLQMVQGNVSKNNIHISSYKEFEFVEGTMLDGNILDDQPIRDVLLDLKKENVDSVRLVVDSGQILVKCSVLPEVSHKQMLQFVKDEFIDVESQYTDLLYDYAVIKDKVEGKEGQLVLCAAMEREFLKPYIDLFDEMAQKAFINEPEFSKQSLQIEIPSSNPNRFETFFRYKRTGIARVESTTAEAGF